jgi:hypothetical protein
MKTLTQLKLSLLFGLLLTVFAANSNTTPPTTTINSSAEKTIQNYFRFPQILLPAFEKQSENRVEVIFTTNNLGQVNFALAKTQNKELKKEIEKQFSGLKLPQLKENVTHSVVLNFKAL